MKKLYTYIGLVILSFFIFSVTRLYASTVEGSSLVFNYNDKYVVNNHSSDFFGENGYLELARAEMEKRGLSYTILFTKNNICVVDNHGGDGYDSLKFTFNYDYSDSSINYDFWYVNHSMCLSDFNNNINMFLLGLSSKFPSNDYGGGILNRSRQFSRNSPKIENFPLTDFKGKMNFFELGFDDYVIPYYYSEKTLFENDVVKYVDFICDSKSYLCPEKLYVNNNSGIVQGFNSQVEFFQSYNNLYGYQEPSLNIEPEYQSFEVYNNAFIIDYDELNGSGSSFSFKVVDGIQPVISSIEYYGLVNDNGLMHYEKLPSDYITQFNYNTSFSNRIFTFSFDVNSFIYTDYVYDQKLSKYDKIYVKVNYENPVKYNKNSYSFSLGLVDQVVLNDVCSECLFLQLDSSGRNTYMFSANKDFDSSKIYFSDVISNDFLYNEFAYVDLSSKTLLSHQVNYVYRQYYYGYFNRLLFDNYKLSSNIGVINNLYMFAVADDKDVNKDYNFGYSRSYQMLYFITPNIYWGSGVYTDNRDSFSGSYVDSDGNRQDLTISGDFTNKRSDLVNSTGISGFFKSAFEKGKDFVNCGVEILSLVTSLFNSFPVSVQSLILLIFFISLIIILIKFIS